jgi:hypothetical protein
MMKQSVAGFLCFIILHSSFSNLAAPRPPDIPFRIQMIDGGASETAAVADINHDGRLDILSGEYWYEAPAWTKHRFRDLDFTQQYIDDFSDLIVDVDGDGFPDVVSVSWFAKRIAWWHNPGRGRGSPRVSSGRGSPRVASSHGSTRVASSHGSTRISTDSGSYGSATIRVDPWLTIRGDPWLTIRGDPWQTIRGDPWPMAEIHSGFNIEFAVLADVDNDGKAREIVAQENGTGQAWYEVQQGRWVAHVISDKSYGHGIGVGDVNKDGRNDILTPRGWLEAPPDPRAPGWMFHADWEAVNVTQPAAGGAPRMTDLGFMHVADVNGDGRNDVLAAAGHDYGVFWFEQGAGGHWTRHVIDEAWSQGHASTLADLNQDGRPDLVTGKRFMAHNGRDPGEREPLGVYWYEYRPGQVAGSVEWVRHIIDVGGRLGGGMQIPVVDIDGDGDQDLVCAGKSGLFLIENLTKGRPVKAAISGR